MSSPTNGYSPQQVTRNSFNFTSNPFLLSKTARPKSSPVKSKRSKIGPRQLAINEQQYQQQQQQQQQQLEDIPLDSSTPALQDLVIYIDKSVVNRNSLTGIANALAATVLDKWSPSVTHLIHGTIAQHSHQQRQQSLQQGSSLKRHQGQRTPPIISKSLERKMRVVSPAWLTACYNNKERMPESLYPHEMNSHHRMSSLRHDPSMHSMADENPFGLEPDEFATVESCDSEDNDGGPVANDRRVTDYFQPTNNNTRNKKSTTHDGNGNDDQPDNLYTDMNHLDFDDVDHAGNGGITNDRENGKHGTINKGRKDDDDDDNDHAMSMSYSLIEMSQVQPPQQPQFSDGIPHTPPRQQLTYHGACAYEPTTTENQLTKAGSLEESPMAASVERSIQQMMAMDDGSQPMPTNHATAQEPRIKIDEEYYGDYGDDDDDDDDDGGAVPLPALPDLDPERQPKVTLGREDRLQIWYGEQSFCLDAGMPLSRKKRNEWVDLTSSSLPPQEKSNPTPMHSSSKSMANKSPATTTATMTTTTKRLKKSHQ